ncbi:hypothetical protein FNF27_02752 [Cafeteria roenbergensis]|uniref:Selenoprotein K n=1 Tax=Cafeteria roenbergensis TaxID=33653 RepID=A0A5A8EIS5_CAFRO|nr:hypothetical protein FNF31_06983 [Cafeteria roenbergensis]KAA0153314.1 hypothetical protein FNF29_03127 [Cafeteria roenbergensis]KAA0170411.1 hypothetical protein FNF28_01406 [Cafeteria roenbergensis]KAA0175671.1 hypothetical protein FNF27_02752 [Cafeteria roenbergensis]|eukprot:KAA0153314.1 hypothetical protein FNF29_03127 [Cafeteria roenbergensis]
MPTYIDSNGNLVEREYRPPSCCSLAYWADVFWAIVSVVYLFALSCCDPHPGKRTSNIRGVGDVFNRRDDGRGPPPGRPGGRGGGGGGGGPTRRFRPPPANRRPRMGGVDDVRSAST